MRSSHRLRRRQHQICNCAAITIPTGTKIIIHSSQTRISATQQSSIAIVEIDFIENVGSISDIACYRFQARIAAFQTSSYNGFRQARFFIICIIAGPDIHRTPFITVLVFTRLACKNSCLRRNIGNRCTIVIHLARKFRTIIIDEHHFVLSTCFLELDLVFHRPCHGREFRFPTIFRIPRVSKFFCIILIRRFPSFIYRDRILGRFILIQNAVSILKDDGILIIRRLVCRLDSDRSSQHHVTTHCRQPASKFVFYVFTRLIIISRFTSRIVFWHRNFVKRSSLRIELHIFIIYS